MIRLKPECCGRGCGTSCVEPDTVNNPSHYTEGREYEPIDVIQDWDLDFLLGNALKYISRAGRKNSETEDLRKAVFYLSRRITELEEAKATDNR